MRFRHQLDVGARDPDGRNMAPHAPNGIKGPAVAVKVVTVILGLVTVILGWHAYFWSFFNSIVRYDELWYIDSLIEEKAFLGTTLVLLIISIVYLVFNAVNHSMAHNQANKVADFVYHLLGAIVLLVVGSLMIYSTVDIDCNKCLQLEWYIYERGELEWVAGVRCQLYEEKLAAGVIALLNGILYGAAGIITISQSSYY